MGQNETKRLAFCCYKGQERSVDCADTAQQTNQEATWVLGGWKNLLEISDKQAVSMLQNAHINDHIVLIDDDIYPPEKEKLTKILTAANVSFEFVSKGKAFDIARGMLLPQYRIRM